MTTFREEKGNNIGAKIGVCMCFSSDNFLFWICERFQAYWKFDNDLWQMLNNIISQVNKVIRS